MATFIGVFGTLVTVYVGISKYVDEKENERTAAYRDALYRIFSADINDNNRLVWQLEDVQFGIEKDRGKNFEIQVLVIPQSLINNGIPVESGRLFIEAGAALPNRTMVTVLRPKFPTSSNVVRVTRR